MAEIHEEMNSILDYILEKHDISERRLKSHCTIFPVPTHISKGRKGLFHPRIVSIGPYHHGKPEFKEMEQVKLQFLRELTGTSLGVVIECVKNLAAMEGSARNSYFNEFPTLDKKQFVHMLLLDGLFIIQILKLTRKNKSDVLGNSWWNLGMMMHDFFLLENQLPFNVLEYLYRVICPPQETLQTSLQEMAIKFLLQEETTLRTTPAPASTELQPSPYHLLDLCRRHYTNHNAVVSEHATRQPRRQFSIMPFGRHDNNSPEPVQTIPSATRLVEAGVTFRKKKNPRNFLDFNFENGVMEIPPISIHEDMMYRLANLVALEQCTDVDQAIRSYAIFMDCIIDTPEDVEIFRRRGILGKMMASNKKVADFFNQLCGYAQLDFQKHYLHEVFGKVDAYCKSIWHEQRAKLVRDYFGNPWAFISLVAAAFLLILTFLQAFFQIYSYYIPRSPRNMTDSDNPRNLTSNVTGF